MSNVFRWRTTLPVRVKRGGQFIRCGLSCRVELNLSNCGPLAMTDAMDFDTNSDERGRNLTLYLLAPIVLCALAPGLRKVELTT
jgi:hypothetical protein